MGLTASAAQTVGILLGFAGFFLICCVCELPVHALPKCMWPVLPTHAPLQHQLHAPVHTLLHAHGNSSSTEHVCMLHLSPS